MGLSNQEQGEAIRWCRYSVGSDGFICLVDWMGDDASICQAASVSYGMDGRDGNQEDNEKLLRYLMRHQHTTPFEMAEIKFLVRVPMDTWRQWVRHRTANINEYSTRYKPAIDSMATTESNEWRLQSSKNKQGSDGYFPAFSDDTVDGEDLTKVEASFHELARTVYQTRLNSGVAREQARKDLPLSTYTEAYWKCDLHNIFNFLRLRMDSHAQLEIRQYAGTMAKIVEVLFPKCWNAFNDYVLHGMRLTLLDRIAIQTRSVEHITDKREREECLQKLMILGIDLHLPSK